MSDYFWRRDPEAGRARVRARLADRSTWPFITPLVHDAISASIAEQEGLDGVFLGGYGVSVTRLGLPDLGFLSLSDVAPVVDTILARTRVSLFVDCDTGFGNAVNVMHTTEQILGLGAAGLTLEDQLSPKRCGHVAGKQVVPIDEFVTKIRAAVRVRDELAPGAVIIARCDARGVAGGTIEDVIERGKAYAGVGADIVFAEGIFDVEELARCGAEIGAPLLYNMTGDSPILPPERLRELGIFQVIAGSAYRPAFKAIQDHFRQLATEGFVALHDAPKPPFLHKISGLGKVLELERDLVTAEENDRRYGGSMGFAPGRETEAERLASATATDTGKEAR